MEGGGGGGRVRKIDRTGPAVWTCLGMYVCASVCLWPPTMKGDSGEGMSTFVREIWGSFVECNSFGKQIKVAL